MCNLLNISISSTVIGIISLVVLAIVLIAFFVAGIRKGIKGATKSFFVFLIALAGAVFVAKPALSLFDSLFGFSMIFFDMLMVAFGQFQILNTQVNASNFAQAVQNFQSSDVGMSSTLKDFLLKVFERTVVPAGQTTTLGAVASTSISYMIALFIVALILFVVIYAVVSLILKLFIKKSKTKAKANVFGGLFGLIKGVAVCLILLVTLSTLPFSFATDYLASGFESTKFFSPVYQKIVEVEQTVYVSALDFESINKNASQSPDTITIGQYTGTGKSKADKVEGSETAGTESQEVSITIQITSSTALTETIKDASTSQLVSQITYAYIHANGKIYLYQQKTVGDDNSYVLATATKYDQKAGKIEYSNKINGKAYSGTLAIVTGD